MASPTFPDGHVVAGRYLINELIGIGRTAEVYRAEDTSLHRTVVVKVLLPELVAHDEVRRAFRDHIVRAATLSHPHLARVFDGGQEGGAIFMVTEFLGGGSLEELFEEDVSLNVDQVARLARDVASALSYAHQNGFVHGNLSPSKLLFDDEGHVRVSDIALAGLADGYRDSYSVNDARYVSPEQAAGNVPVPNSDVYALALILYEAVTGRRAFEGQSVEGLLRARLEQNIPPTPELGSLDMLIAQASVPQPDYRCDADTFQQRLGAVVADSSSFEAPRRVQQTLLDHAPQMQTRTSIGFNAPTAAQVAGGREGATPTPHRAIPTSGFSDETVDRLSGFERPRRRLPVKWIVAAVVVVALAAGAAWKLGLYSQSHTVPALTNLTYQKASDVLKGDGFTLTINQHANSPTVPAGEIMAQNPSPGTVGKAGLNITVTVSDGPKMIALPAKLVGEDCVTATAQLQKVGLLAQCPTSAAVASKTVPAGRIAQVVYQGTVNPKSVPSGSTVVLALSTGANGATTGTTTTVKGATTTTVKGATTTTTKKSATTTTTAAETMPNLVGLTRAAVNVEAHKYLFYYATTGPGAGTSTWTKVTAQSIAPGTPIHKFVHVTLTVAK